MQSTARFRFVLELVVAVMLAGGLLATQGSSPTYALNYTVTTAADSGAGSLRAMITSANANPGVDYIYFNIPGTGPFTITLASNLPVITSTVQILGTTQPGYAGTPLIRINGNSVALHCLESNASATSVKISGLAIGNCTGHAIHLASSSAGSISANYIGTFDGSTGAPNNGGVVFDNVDNYVIGGATAANRNVFASNLGTDVFLSPNSDGNYVQGNYFGTNSAGTAALANDNGADMEIYGSNNTIGGSTAGYRNLFNRGILIRGSYGGQGNIVLGNFFGTDYTGQIRLPGSNLSAAVYITDSSNNTIGGLTTGARNLLDGGTLGVAIYGNASTGNKVLGNYIGVGVSGTQNLGNSVAGVLLDGAGANTIGGVYPAASNLILYNGTGIKVDNSQNISILSNRIENNSRGIDMTSAGPSTVAANSMNCISGNSVFGMSNTTGVLTVATGNWWGATNGPSGAGSGSGNSVSSNVTFTPWDTTSCANALGQRVLNGSMEIDSNSDTVPDSWTVSGMQAGLDGRICTTAAIGICSYRIQPTNNTKKKLMQVITGSGVAGDDINTSLYVRTVNLPAGSIHHSIIVKLTYTDGTTGSTTFFMPTGTTGWTLYTVPTLVAAKNYNRIDITITYGSTSGEVDIDGVSLRINP